MYDGAREIRKAEALRNKHDVLRANRAGETMRPGDTKGVPVWAIEAKGVTIQ